MTIDAEKLRALLAKAQPRPWHAGFKHWGKADILRHDPTSRNVSSGVGPYATVVPDIEPDDAALIVAAVNALPELLDALATAAQVSDRVQTIADESFGPFPVEPIDESLTHIERGIFGLRQALATAEAERLTLARALRTGNGHLDQAASELAARIVAEADAEVRRG